MFRDFVYIYRSHVRLFDSKYSNVYSIIVRPRLLVTLLVYRCPCATMHFLYCTLIASALAAPWHMNNHTRAIYTLSNDPSGNNLLSLAISPTDGTVSSPVLTSTGGKGLRGLNVGPPFGAPGSPAGPDSLFGQGAVSVSHNVRRTTHSSPVSD